MFFSVQSLVWIGIFGPLGAFSRGHVGHLRCVLIDIGLNHQICFAALATQIEASASTGHKPVHVFIAVKLAVNTVRRYPEKYAFSTGTRRAPNYLARNAVRGMVLSNPL